MRKNRPSFFIVLLIILLPIIIYPYQANAGQAGVGVINVPPKYGYIRVEEQGDYVRVYLNISDYNSWADVYNVTVTLENYGKKLSTFVFQQYKDFDSFVESNEFSETPKKSHLLDTKKCFFEKSTEQETIDQRCDIAIRFVFQKTFFTGLSIVINDRAGSAPAEAYIYYNSEESLRSGNTLVIPWIGVQLTLSLPPYLLDIIAIILATLGVMYYLKKTGIREKRKKTYKKIS
ncbi:MAG: hypothetical protein H6P94_298 [Thermoplasmatales archaeon]|jgi:hypothetical protein|nr:hypothetical protein [Thermoplasmatales archaeon]